MPRARISRDLPPRVVTPRIGDSKAHLKFIRRLPCVVCGARDVDPHHLTGPVEGRPREGMQATDRWAVPVCRKHHTYGKDCAHAPEGDEAWFASKGIQARNLARALWHVSGDDEEGLRVVLKFHQGGQMAVREASKTMRIS